MEGSHEMVDHEMHLVLHVLEEFVDKLDENQPLDISHRNLSCFLERVFSPWKIHMSSP